jgi:hypothetical protein
VPEANASELDKDLYATKQEENEQHMKRKVAARNKLAEILQGAGDDHRVIEFDLEACLTLPKSNANIVYFR